MLAGCDTRAAVNALFCVEYNKLPALKRTYRTDLHASGAFTPSSFARAAYALSVLPAAFAMINLYRHSITPIDRLWFNMSFRLLRA
jgi:hypothetical protein